MPFFLDYEAEGNIVGHVQIPRVSAQDAFLYAMNALRGMDCLRAVLRSGETIWDVHRQRNTMAQYTCDEGWQR